MTLTIDPEFKDLIPPLTTEEFDGLEQNILQHGCRVPLDVWGDILVDGHNRHAICQKHGLSFQTKQVTFENKNDAKIWIINNQFDRRNLSSYTRSVLALKMEGFYKEKAKINQLSTLKQNQSVLEISPKRNALPFKATSQPFAEFQRTYQERKSTTPINTRVELAKIAGVSENTIAKVKKIVETATPEVKAKVERGEMSINEAHKQIYREEKATQQEQRRQENLIIVQQSKTEITKISDVTQRFATLVLDPPWDWGDEGDVSQFGRARPEYATMSIEQIAALPIANLAEQNAHIYLWITNRSLPKGFVLLEAWGFRYVTCLTWCKPSIGMGNYFRGSSEQILFGVKGSLALNRHDVGTWFAASRPSRHSEKPQEAYQIIESCSPPLYLEMFARQPRQNWFTWGGEL